MPQLAVWSLSLLVQPGRMWKAGMRIFSGSCLMLLSTCEMYEIYSYDVFLCYSFSHPCDLHESKRLVRGRVFLYLPYVEEEERDLNGSVTFYMRQSSATGHSCKAPLPGGTSVVVNVLCPSLLYSQLWWLFSPVPAKRSPLF